MRKKFPSFVLFQNKRKFLSLFILSLNKHDEGGLERDGSKKKQFVTLYHFENSFAMCFAEMILCFICGI